MLYCILSCTFFEKRAEHKLSEQKSGESKLYFMFKKPFAFVLRYCIRSPCPLTM